MAYKIDPKTGKRIEIDNITGKPVGLEVKEAVQQPKEEKVGGFWKSGLKFGKELGSAAINLFNPNLEKNTAVNLGRLGLAGVTALIPGKQGPEDFGKPLVESYKKRYSGNMWENFKDDPFSYAADAATVATLGGGAVSKLGQVAKLGKLAKVGGAITKAGELIDPLSIVGKSTRIGQLPKVTGKIGEGVESLGKTVSGKVIRVTPLQADKFKTVAKTSFPEYLVNKGIQGSADDMIRASANNVRAVGDAYDMVLLNKKTPTKPLFDKLNKQVEALKGTGSSPKMLRDAARLQKEVDALHATIGGTDVIGTEGLREIKTAAFEKYNPVSTSTTRAKRIDEIIGNTVINHLEEYIPGSKVVGKEYQAAIAADKLVKKNAPLGTGLKLGMEGRLAGKAIGFSAAGIPGLAGEIVLEKALNSPKVVGKVGTAMQGLGKGLQNTSPTMQKFGNIAKTAETVSRVSEPLAFQNGTQAVEQPIANTQPTATTTSNTQQSPQNIYLSDGTVDFSKLPTRGATSEESDYITGHSPKEIYREMIKAHQYGDTKTASFLYKMYTDEMEYQKSSQSSGKIIPASTITNVIGDANSAMSAMAELETSLTTNSGSIGPIAGRLRGKNPLSGYDSAFQDVQNSIQIAQQVVGKYLEGGVLRAEDIPKYEKILPTVKDTPIMAATKLAKVKRLIEEKLANNKAELAKAGYDLTGGEYNQGDIPFDNGQSAF